MNDRSKRIRSAFNDLDARNLDVVDQFYAPDVIFEDPLGRIEGREELRAYYAAMYQTVLAIRFEFADDIVQDQSHVAFWSMFLRAPRLNKGREIAVEGNSLIRFGGPEDQVIYHRDYFDMGAMVYHHIPLLGRVVRHIRKRLSH